MDGDIVIPLPKDLPLSSTSPTMVVISLIQPQANRNPENDQPTDKTHTRFLYHEEEMNYPIALSSSSSSNSIQSAVFEIRSSAAKSSTGASSPSNGSEVNNALSSILKPLFPTLNARWFPPLHLTKFPIDMSFTSYTHPQPCAQQMSETHNRNYNQEIDSPPLSPKSLPTSLPPPPSSPKQDYKIYPSPHPLPQPHFVPSRYSRMPKPPKPNPPPTPLNLDTYQICYLLRHFSSLTSTRQLTAREQYFPDIDMNFGDCREFFSGILYFGCEMDLKGRLGGVDGGVEELVRVKRGFEGWRWRRWGWRFEGGEKWLGGFGRVFEAGVGIVSRRNRRGERVEQEGWVIGGRVVSWCYRRQMDVSESSRRKKRKGWKVFGGEIGGRVKKPRVRRQKLRGSLEEWRKRKREREKKAGRWTDGTERMNLLWREFHWVLYDDPTKNLKGRKERGVDEA